MKPQTAMDSQARYPRPEGVYAIPHQQLDLRPDTAVDDDLLNPRPVSDDKNVWFFWHSGFEHMHAYTQRTVRAWHRRFSRQGWAVRVVDSASVARWVDAEMLPQAFVDGAMSGEYARQHMSDLVRWPLLLRHGGVYADVGLVQIGDLDRLWNETVGDARSPYEVLTYNAGGIDSRSPTNYFLAARRGNAFFARCHRLLLALWAADGGRESTDGMHASSLLRGLPLIGGSLSVEGREAAVAPEEVRRQLTDYIIQGQVVTMVLGLVDDNDGWHGPRYTAEHVYAIEYMAGSQLINQLTLWDGPRQFDLLSLPLPRDGDAESKVQRLARTVVEACLRTSFAFKLAHGFIVKVMGDTLGSLWRKHDGADNVPGTYAHWLRHGMLYWCPEDTPGRLEFKELPPFKKGPLLSDG